MNTSTSQTPSVMSSSSSNLPYSFSPSMGIVIVVVIAVLFVLAFLSIYVRRCTRGVPSAGQLEEAANQAAANRPLRNNSSSSVTGKGLDKSVVESLPVVHFKDLKNLEMEAKKNRLGAGGHDDGEGDEDDDDDGGGQHRECAVCLSDFEEDDDLRLLPGCKHVFHQDCIDVWFQSHSTCPLCRASLVPKAAGKHLHDGGDGHEAHDSSVLIEEQEREAGDHTALEAPHHVVVAIHGDDEEGSAWQDQPALVVRASSVRSNEGTTMSVSMGSSISRDDQRDSARLALFRNSRSFKKAARGVVAHERASSTSPRGAPRLETGTSSKSWKPAAPPTTPIIEPMRRSTSLNNSDALKYMKDFFSNNQNPVPKLQSQHSLPATMKLAIIDLPSTTTTTTAIPSSSSNRSSRRTTGSHSGIEFVRTGSTNLVEKPQVMRSNSEHWVSIELDARPESFPAAASSSSKTKPIADKDARIMRKGADQSSGRDSERWNFLNLRNLLSS